MFAARSSRTRRPARGFTLIEAVMVIVITGAIIAVITVFVMPPIQNYFGTSARAQLAGQIDVALRRVERELQLSLPNSVRVNGSGTTLELIPTTAAARYQTEGSGALLFGQADLSFNLLGPGLSVGSSQQLVFYNLGVNVSDANAYADSSASANTNRRTASNAAGTAGTITLAANAGLPIGLFAAPYRVYAVSQPVTYRCVVDASGTTGTLTRYTGYGFLATQPDPPGSGSSSLLAKGVSTCQFSYDSAVIAGRAALVTLRLGLRANTVSGAETVTLYHATHIDNLP